MCRDLAGEAGGFFLEPDFADTATAAVAAQSGLAVPAQVKFTRCGRGLRDIEGYGRDRIGSGDKWMLLNSIIGDKADFRLIMDIRVIDANAILRSGIKVSVDKGDIVVVKAPGKIDPRGAQGQGRAVTGGKVSTEWGVTEGGVALVTEAPIKVR